MPIEDIDFLKKNSIKENYIFIVDSKDREKITFKSPSEYVVNFETPFRNVIGLNLIDASIPRTMYNIDIYNNQIAFYIYDTTNIRPRFANISISIGDYSIQSLLVELNDKLKMRLNNDESLSIISITATSITNPPDIQSRIQFNCPYPFLFNMKNSTIAESLGFDGYIRESEITKPLSERNYEIPRGNLSIIDNHQLFQSVSLPFASLRENTTLFEKNTYTLFEGPKGVIQKLSLNTQKIAQSFKVSFKTNLVKIYVAFESTEISISPIATFSIQKDTNGYPDGIELMRGSIAISFIDGSYSDSADLVLPFIQNTKYWVVFDKLANSAVNIYYNDVLENNNSLKIFNNESGWNTIDNIANSIYYQLCIKIDICDDYNCIKSPGIYSLIGERYIVLRCKEIEENSFRSLAYTKHITGIAKFTMGVIGYKEERFDYFSVPTREFHPIGKLSKLTFRFEISNGQLYDFKDVNHMLTFSIKYLEPIGKVDFLKSIINSNYNGDFMKYQYTQEEQEEDSDDQDIDYNKDEFEKYKQNESKNLPSQVAQRNVQLYYDLNYPEEGDD
jgi:hypothetical protein